MFLAQVQVPVPSRACCGTGRGPQWPCTMVFLVQLQVQWPCTMVYLVQLQVPVPGAHQSADQSLHCERLLYQGPSGPGTKRRTKTRTRRRT